MNHPIVQITVASPRVDISRAEIFIYDSVFELVPQPGNVPDALGASVTVLDAATDRGRVARNRAVPEDRDADHVLDPAARIGRVARGLIDSGYQSVRVGPSYVIDIQRLSF